MSNDHRTTNKMKSNQIERARVVEQRWLQQALRLLVSLHRRVPLHSPCSAYYTGSANKLPIAWWQSPPTYHHHHHHFICPIGLIGLIQQYAHLHEYDFRRARQQGPTRTLTAALKTFNKNNYWVHYSITQIKILQTKKTREINLFNAIPKNI